MNITHVQLDRLLDPLRGNVTLETLQRAEHFLGREPPIDLRREHDRNGD